MLMDKKIILTIILISVFLISGCLVKNKFNFQVGPCNETIDIEDETKVGFQRATTISTDYEGKVFFEAESYVVMNCAEKVNGGSFERIGDDMFLRYSQTDCNEDDSCQDCRCASLIIHTIDYVPDRHYNITLQEI